MTKPDGWVVLNADDPCVAAVARRVRRASPGSRSTRIARRSSPASAAAGGRAYGLLGGSLVEWDEGDASTRSSRPPTCPVALGGLARHNVANALAAAGGARALGMTIAQVADGLRDFRPSAERSPGRLNLFRLGSGS